MIFDRITLFDPKIRPLAVLAEGRQTGRMIAAAEAKTWLTTREYKVLGAITPEAGSPC
jgi:hypothetical protein